MTNKKRRRGKRWFYADGMRAAALGYPFQFGNRFERNGVPHALWRAWQQGYMDYNNSKRGVTT